MLTKRMPRIGYVEPYQVASIVFINKIYARIRFLLTKRMPSIGHVDQRSNYSFN